MKLTKNFKSEEFNCKDGSETPKIYLDNICELAEQLQIIRNTIEVPIAINSGYRSIEHNIKIGGKPNSYHLTGQAADIMNRHYSPKETAVIIEALMLLGKIKKGGIGIYKTFVHYDTRGTIVKW